MVKKILVLSTLFLMILQSGLAQEKLNKRANQNYEEYSFSPAIDIYKKVLDRDYVSADLLQKLGNSYYFNANYEAAAPVYKRLIAEYEKEITAAYYFRYAQTLRSLGEYDEADVFMTKFRTSAGYDNKDSNRNYRKEIKENSNRYEIELFPYNSKYSDFAPSFYKEGLIFSSDRDTGNLARYRHTWNSKDFLDLYKVNVDSSSADFVTKLEGEMNTRLHESTSAATKDGNTIYFTRNNFKDKKYVKDKDGFIRLKIFKATRENGIWTTIEELPFNNDTYSVAHPALSPDEKYLYFASDMPGSLGESDIFRVAIKTDGTYGTPENLGDNINTPNRETFPFVTSENVLYFSSNGHYGLGGLDVFATKVGYDNFDIPVLNVGEPVNSKQDDFTFIFDEKSLKGYFASSRDPETGDNIYSFIETKPLNLDCIQQISGTVRDKISNEVLAGATVKVINENNEEIGNTITDANGDYELILDCNQGNFVRATIQGYIPSEEYLPKSNNKPKIIDFYMERETVTAGGGDDLAKLLQLSTIYFDLNKFNIRPDAEVEIQKVIAAMEKYPSLRIQVNSYTDSRGNDAYNLWLSKQRAASTVAYMISKGINKDRLVGEGYGETRLVNDCSNGVRCSKEEHQLNRRSEFIIL